MPGDKGRYRSEPPDLVQKVIDLERRIQQLERLPQAGQTAVNQGTFIATDASGNPRLNVGLLSDGSYGMEVKETNQNTFHQVPYLFADSVATAETTTSGTYVDLTTVGPTVTVPVRSSGRLLIMLSSQVNWNQVTQATSGGQGGTLSVAMSGANTMTAAAASAQLIPAHYWNWSTGGALFAEGTLSQSATAFAVFSGLTPGLTTIQAKYQSTAGTTISFRNRNIAVFAL